ncbi:MAG: ComF family protein [Balneola sp.]
MLTSIKSIKKGFLEVLFPRVCTICGLSLSESEQFICPDCTKNRFEVANPDRKRVSSDTLLPEGVELQHALWNFDKGGYLQDLLHSLKYHRLTGVGIDLGVALGNSLKKNPFFCADEDKLLIPVPLHPKKRRMRGYNQARYIARGVERSAGIEICLKDDVIRIKNTKTQTGFSLEKRRENINQAFLVKNPLAIKDKICVVIDDVFTTGATAFELADTLLKAGARKIMIATIAQA